MRKRVNEVEQEGFQIIAIAPSNSSYISQFQVAFGEFPFLIAGDPKREAYRGMGHHTMPKWKLLGQAAIGFVTRKLDGFIPKEQEKKDFVLKSMKTQDVYIQGGTWIYDERGVMIWNHIDQSPEDHAKIDTVLDVLKKNKA
ncbi:AhpC/TSA family protein [Guptibacillus hwajinpoensis]|uniref:AhpC/TSA family protein n=1 Tax=Guptibacillus hwajinpoensis TaxID=208199 RepID=UPI00350F3189